MATTRPLDGEAFVPRSDAADGDALIEEEVAERKSFASGWRLWALRVAVLVFFIAAWQVFTGKPGQGLALVDKFWVSQPSDILTRLDRWIDDGTLWFQLAITLREMVSGFAIGALIAVCLGFVLARNLVLARLVDPFMIAFYSIPKLALAPLFILWFGIGLEPKVVLVATVVFFLVFVNTYAGFRDVDQELIDCVRLMGASRRDVFTKVVLPSASAWIFTGLKLAVPNSLIAAVVGELMAANRGLGFLLLNAQGQFDTAGVMAIIVLLMLMGWGINEGVNRAESHLLRWKLTAQ